MSSSITQSLNQIFLTKCKLSLLVNSYWLDDTIITQCDKRQLSAVLINSIQQQTTFLQSAQTFESGIKAGTQESETHHVYPKMILHKDAEYQKLS